MPTISERDSNVIAGVLRATVEGPLFPTWEFQSVFGFDREIARTVLAAWPRQMWTEHTYDVVRSSFDQLLGHPHGQWAAWAAFSDAPISELQGVGRRYAAAHATFTRERRRGT